MPSVKKKIFLVVGYVVLPKVTLNPIHSHKPTYCKVNNDHHGDLLPLVHLSKQCHHGDLLPLGHLSEQCPSRGSNTHWTCRVPIWGATTPWAGSNMGDLLPPEDITIS